MQLLTIGPRGYTVGLAVTNKVFQPLFDRAAQVTDVRITAPSANDSWTFSVGGKELFRTYVSTAGYQNVFGEAKVLGVDNRGWLPYLSDLLGRWITIPVPQGQALTIASVGGATANISIEYKEVSPADVQPSQPNHYLGNESYHPIVQYINAAQAAAGSIPMDTQISSPWVPKLLSGDPVPVNWAIDIIDLFSEPVSVNTFNGAANHVSGTQELQAKYNGQLMFTRDGTGIPLVAQAAAAGAANSVFLPALSRFNSFQLLNYFNSQILDPPISLHGGDNFEFDVVTSGDFTGGASYAVPMVVFAAHIVGSVGG